VVTSPASHSVAWHSIGIAIAFYRDAGGPFEALLGLAVERYLPYLT